MNGNVIRTITIRGTSEGLDKLQADLAKVAAGHKDVSVATEQTEKSTLSLEQALKRQSLRLDEVARAQNNIERETKIANKGLKEGLIDQQRHTELLNLANQRYGTTTKATQEFGKQTGLARHELINLGRQAQDVGVSLVSGQSPLMVLAQQGTQIADVFISSGKSVGDFFSQAITWAGRFLTSTAGIVTAVLAIGAAVTYTAYQFLKSSTTVEQALENQNRLMREATQLAKSRDQTQFEMMRNQIDLQNKLKKEMEDVAKLSERRATSPLQDVGVALGIIAPPVQDPGVAAIAAAVKKLNDEVARGRPDAKAYGEEISRIAKVHPELAKTVEKMLLLNETGIKLQESLREAGVGLAQLDLRKLQTEQAAAATERQAAATLQMAQAYPGMSIEVAKQLDALNGQLAVAEAVGVTAQQEAQHRATINQLLLQGKTLTEAIAIADAQRAIALAQIEAAHQVTMVSLQGQLLVAQQITGLGQINAQHEATINNLKLQGLSLSQATAQADMQRAIALAQVNAAAQVRLHDLQDEMQLIKAVDDIARDRIRSEQTLNKLLSEGVDYYLAQQVAAQELANAEERRAQADYDAERRKMEAAQDAATAVDATAAAGRSFAASSRQAAADWERIKAASAQVQYEMAYIPFGTQWAGQSPSGINTQMWQTSSGQYSQFNPGGYTSSRLGVGMTSILEANARLPAAGSIEAFTEQFNAALTQSGGDLGSAVGGLISRGGIFTGSEADPQKLQLLDRAINLMSKEQQIGAYQGLMGQLGGAPQTLQTAELTKQLGEKLTELTRATDENTSATSAMTDVLSPFYSSDPRQTHLGFRAFASGGIMTQYGELPLRNYQGGGMATSPQVAVFGEGSTPEAYVPIPSGRIPVEIKQPANNNQRPVNVTINVMGNADAGTVAALKQTSFQKAQQLRRMAG